MTSGPRFELSEEQRALRETIREFAASEIAPRAAERDRTRALPADRVSKRRRTFIGSLGLHAGSDRGDCPVSSRHKV